MSIRTRVTTQEYRDNWDQVFGNKKKAKKKSEKKAEEQASDSIPTDAPLVESAEKTSE